MKVSIVSETYWPELNGLSMTLQQLINGLIEKEHHLQLICPSNKQRFFNISDRYFQYTPVVGIPVPGYKGKRIGFSTGRYLGNCWNKNQPDIIFVASEGLLGRLAVSQAKKMGIPVVSAFNYNISSYSNYFQVAYLKKIIKNYQVRTHHKSQTTLVSTDSQKEFVKHLGMDNVQKLARGVDTTLFTPDKRDQVLRASWGVDEESKVLLFVGRMSLKKNLNLAIRTYYTLSKLDANIKFVFVGDGPDKEVLQRQHPQFIFAGIRIGEELAKYFASCDIFLLPSMNEHYGNVVLEAMASGLGVVAFNHAAAKEHIQHKVNGIVAPFNFPNDFRLLAMEFLENEMLLQKTKIKAREYAETQQWQDIVNQFENILEANIRLGMNNEVYPGLSEVKYEN